VCKGSHLLSKEFHKEFINEPRIPAWNPEWFGFTDAGMKWLADKGCEWVKVCAEPGDLLVRRMKYSQKALSRRDI
jgi:hypothetical protein